MMTYVPRRKGERRSVWMDLGDKHGRQTPERSYHEDDPEPETFWWADDWIKEGKNDDE